MLSNFLTVQIFLWREKNVSLTPVLPAVLSGTSAETRAKKRGAEHNGRG